MKYLGQPQSGSQANTTASHNRAGQYLRNRRAPVSPTRTPKQGVARARFGSASAAWQSLTSALQSAWTSFAMAYPVVDALGQSIVLTGQQYFIGIQSTLLHVGLDINTAIPTNTSTPAVDTPQQFVNSEGSIVVMVNSIAIGDFNPVGASPVLSNGVNFNKQFSLFAVLNSTALSADISNSYAAQYGAPIAGKKIFFNTKEVNSSGMSGPDTIQQQSVAGSPSINCSTPGSTTAGEIEVSGASTTATLCIAYQVQGTTETALEVGRAPLVAGACTITGLTTGINVYIRVFDGHQISNKSGPVVVT